MGNMKEYLMRTAIFRLAAVFALVAGALVFGTAVSADGATVQDVDSCVTTTFLYGPPRIVCVDAHIEYNTTTTPSGNFSVDANFHGTSTVTVAGQTTSSALNGHFHVLLQDGTPQVINQNTRQTITSPNGQTVCITLHYHSANGQVQFSDFDVTPGAC